MKQVVAITALIVIVTVIIVPLLVIRGLSGMSAAGMEERRAYKGEDITIRVYLHEKQESVEMSLEEYLKGVIAAEMPVEFELEALKAQAVAARTYAIRHIPAFGGKGMPGRPGVDVSTDSRESQAWISKDELKSRWGPDKYSIYWHKITLAVESTRGVILTYQGEPINAVFHSTSGDKTASSEEVWGVAHPYLKSVSSIWDKQSPRYSDTKEISLVELENKLGSDAGVMLAAQNGNPAIAQIIDRTESGRVKTARLGSKTFSGIDIRDKLGLRSTNFTIEQKQDKLLFKTVGYGHGVGMSQYGANGMAKEGKNFKEILMHYYTGVALTNIYGS